MSRSLLRHTSHQLALGLMLGLAALASTMPAHATTITFDDLGSNHGAGAIQDGYAGLDWNNFYYLTASGNPSLDPSGYLNGMVSASNVAFNAFGQPAYFASSTPFTFNSAYFTAAWNNGLSINVVGYRDGNAVHAANFTVDATGPSHEVFDWSNVDKVRFSSYGGTSAGFGGSGPHFAMDNLAINVRSVPEPSGLGILVLGVGMIGLLARRRRRMAAWACNRVQSDGGPRVSRMPAGRFAGRGNVRRHEHGTVGANPRWRGLNLSRLAPGARARGESGPEGGQPRAARAEACARGVNPGKGARACRCFRARGATGRSALPGSSDHPGTSGCLPWRQDAPIRGIRWAWEPRPRGLQG